MMGLSSVLQVFDPKLNCDLIMPYMKSQRITKDIHPELTIVHPKALMPKDI